ncbi:hypothetical protein OZN62_08570 [Aurantiacibacter sp. MUD11]|uniref:hypothetical protein n=1 Tax=Aurantiacibacter sp. MUD11 TaxID=3003265 RepID=UPI0022AA7EA2|nr:hypothetical protein [Aurantiacibacter sp. MUD11]WAT16994.1 hypothetical protein OZN62_08570 [Aurantiacibacter sp. MUD11]
MGYLFMIVVGATFGWLAALMRKALTLRGLALNLGGGVAGALVAGLFVGPAIADGNLARGTYSVEAVLISMIGSLALLLVANLLRNSEMG